MNCKALESHVKNDVKTYELCVHVTAAINPHSKNVTYSCTGYKRYIFRRKTVGDDADQHKIDFHLI